MAQNSKIEWCDNTHNFWTGCTAVSPACDHCYADALVTRFGGNFANRVRTSAANWRKPLVWNKRGQARVFTNSLSDFFDNQVDPTWRADAWGVIRATPNLTWMILTKRPQNIAKMLPADWGDGWPNVWLGTTVENQTEAERRIPHLLAVPAKVHFLSCEPLLGAVDLMDDDRGPLCGYEPTREQTYGPHGMHYLRHGAPKLDWVICGGESGRDARPMHPDWARSLRDQCVAAGVAFHFKQHGEWLIGERQEIAGGWPRINFQDGDHFSVVSDGCDIVLCNAEDHRGEPKKIWREFWSDGAGNLAKRPGKKAAGRLLDGREWNESP